jgi:dihydrofolate reductase
MRNVVLSVAISLDGYIEGPKGEYDWCFQDPDYDFMALFERFDTIFVGRKTYAMSAEMGGGPSGFPKFKEFVFSTTLKEVKNGATLINGDLKSAVESIKQAAGKDIWLFGGASLTESMMSLGLIDELSLAVYPVLLGGGKPLFTRNDQRINLELLESKSYQSGLMTVRYLVDRKNVEDQ